MRRFHQVFVVGTGRCGTTTFARACGHLDNWSAGHETNAKQLGADRFVYPRQHIEVDSRLSWFLGDLVDLYPRALYVHLYRDPEDTARSIASRWHGGAISFSRAFGESMVMQGRTDDPEVRLECARFQVQTVNANIRLALNGGAVARMEVNIVEPTAFRSFLRTIDAEGDIEQAVATFGQRHNASPRRAAAR